jgi:hypothetical protein
MNPSPNPAVPRRRGAPKGNLNALKHGLYSTRPSASTDAASACTCAAWASPHSGGTEAGPAPSAIPNPQSEIPPSSSGLSLEIRRLRSMLDAVYQLSRRTQDPLEYLTYLKTYADLCNALTRMIRTQHLITPSVDPHWATLQDVSRELTAGWPGGPAPWDLPDRSGDPAYQAQIQREIDDLRHETAEYTRLDPEPDPFAILGMNDHLPDHPHASYCPGEPSGCMGRATDCTSQASTCTGGAAEYTSHTSTCTGGASEHTSRASHNPIQPSTAASLEPCPAHPRASSPLSTPMNNLNPSAGPAAAEWELVNNAWDSLDRPGFIGWLR